MLATVVERFFWLPHIIATVPAGCATDNGFLPGLYNGLCVNGTIQFSSLADIWILIANVIRILLALAGALAVIFIVVGGLLYVLSTGNSGRIARGKDTVKQAVTGLVICIGAYAIVTFIAARF